MAILLKDTLRSARIASGSAEISSVSNFGNVKVRMPEDSPTSNAQPHDRKINPLYSADDVRSLCGFVRSNGRYEWQKVRNYMLIVLGICTGLRVSDVIRLKLSNIINSDGTFKTCETLYMQKTKRPVQIHFNKLCYDAVLEWLRAIGRDPDRLDCSDLDIYLANKNRDADSAIAEDRLYRIIKGAAAEVGITYNVGSHTMRKTFARIWYEHNKKDNVNAIYVLQKMLGHKSIESTLHYICEAKGAAEGFADTLAEELFDCGAEDNTDASAEPVSSEKTVSNDGDCNITMLRVDNNNVVSNGNRNVVGGYNNRCLGINGNGVGISHGNRIANGNGFRDTLFSYGGYYKVGSTLSAMFRGNVDDTLSSNGNRTLVGCI